MQTSQVTAPVTLPTSGFIGRAEFSTVADVTGRKFTLGIRRVIRLLKVQHRTMSSQPQKRLRLMPPLLPTLTAMARLVLETFCYLQAYLG